MKLVQEAVGNDITLVSFGPIVLFSEIKLTTIDGKDL